VLSGRSHSSFVSEKIHYFKLEHFYQFFSAEKAFARKKKRFLTKKNY